MHYIEHVWSDNELETLCNYFHSQVIPYMIVCFRLHNIMSILLLLVCILCAIGYGVCYIREY